MCIHILIIIIINWVTANSPCTHLEIWLEYMDRDRDGERDGLAWLRRIVMVMLCYAVLCYRLIIIMRSKREWEMEKERERERERARRSERNVNGQTRIVKICAQVPQVWSSFRSNQLETEILDNRVHTYTQSHICISTNETNILWTMGTRTYITIQISIVTATAICVYVCISQLYSST